MPAHRFQWHENTRAFAGKSEVTPQQGSTGSHLPTTPTVQALEKLRKALEKQTHFCITQGLKPRLDTLKPAQFATLTGGTSGQPKIIARSHASWIASFHRNAAHFTYTAQDRIAVLGALSHSLALYGVLEGLHLGLDIHALSLLKPAAQHAALHASACTILYATPTQLRLLPADSPLGQIRLILCGGGMLTDKIRAHLAALAPNAAVHEFYGSAETSFITISDHTTPAGSVGRAYPGVEIEVRNSDDTGTGLIWVRSPYLFDRYLVGSSMHTQRDADWLTVGEYGRLDADGYLFLRGRAGRVINIADTAVFPEELEAQISTICDMPETCILARADAWRGHVLVAVLEGAENPQMRATLLAYLKDKGLVVPRAVEFLDPFPRLPSGKLDLRTIATLTGCTL
jgi:long-chain acyl-CoA synthetase